MTDRRLELITTLLRHYNDVEDTLRCNGIPGSGSRTPQMSEDWKRSSYPELERCLRLMRNEAPWLWWDIRERFLASSRRRIVCPVTRTPKGPRPILPPHTEEIAPIELDNKRGTYLVIQWNPKVNQENVDAGLKWISATFHGEPFLPLSFLETIAA